MGVKTFDQMSSTDQAELIEAMISYAAALTKEREELTRQIDRVNAIIMDMQARYGRTVSKEIGQEIGPYTGKTVFDKDRPLFTESES